MQGKLFIISAPSGAGKTTLVNSVLKRLPSKYPIERVITYTSRVPRKGEQSGSDYHFISPQEFKQKIDQGFFLEWTGEYGHYYGTPRHILDVLEDGYSQVLVITRSGASNLFKIIVDDFPVLSDQVVSVWIQTSDIVELERRLIARGENTSEQIARRMELARCELEQERTNPLYQHCILNDMFLNALQTLEALMLCELKR